MRAGSRRCSRTPRCSQKASWLPKAPLQRHARHTGPIATTLINERVEPLRMMRTDLIAMTVQTFTARCAYQIAAHLSARRRAGGAGRTSSLDAARGILAACKERVESLEVF
jgi:hypothetical protein